MPRPTPVDLLAGYIYVHSRDSPCVIGLRTCARDNVSQAGGYVRRFGGTYLDLKKVLGRAIQLLKGLRPRIR